jgi:hypothetical protein
MSEGGPVTYSKTIICLANSRRPGGRCVAGKEAMQGGYGGWIRPVSPRPTCEITSEERQYEGGQEPRILDIIDVPMIKPAPKFHQTENHTIDTDSYWTKLGDFSWENLAALTDAPLSLWSNGLSSDDGLNDRMTCKAASVFDRSLFLIQPDDVTIRVLTREGLSGRGRRRVRTRFAYRGIYYDFVVTDPSAEELFLARPDGEYTIGNAYFCVGVTPVNSGELCYKLVPTIVPARPE